MTCPGSKSLAALLGLSAAAVVASALGFLRAPVLETRRRVVLTVGAWVGLVALAGGGALGWVALSGPRVPGAVQGAQTDPTGHWISVTDGDYGGLWVMDTAGQHLRRMSRAPVMEYGWAPTGERLMVGFGLSGGREWNWLADPTRGPLRLVGEVAADEAGCDDLPWVWSPRGTYMLEPVGKGSLAITEGQRETRRLGYDLGNVVGWSPDEKTLYVNSASIFGHRLETDVRTFYAVTVATGQERLIAKVTGESVLAGIADGGRWIIGTRWSKDEKGRDRPTGLFLLDIDNGAVTGLPGLYYNRGLGITGGRYLWCAVLAPAPARAWSSWTHVRVDLESRQITARIGREQVGGLRPGTPRVSPAGDLLWFFADPANGNPNEYGPFTLFLAHADGSGLRSLGPAPGAGLVGWTYDDQLIFSDEKAGTILRLDPATGQRKVLYSRAPTGNPRPSDKDWPHAPTLP